MASLTGNTVSSTYVGLLKTTDNADVTGSLKTITGGTGTASALQVSTAGIASTGTLAVTGTSTLAAANVTNFSASGTFALSGDQVQVSEGGTGGTTQATARTGIGIGLDTQSNSSLSGSNGIYQTGSSGADLVFNTAGAPTVSLTAGTWLLIGSVVMRSSVAGDAIWAQFWNSTDSAAFGGSASTYDDTGTGGIQNVPVVGVITVASGTKVIYFKGFRTTTSTLIMGQSVVATPGPAGFIQAIKLVS